MPVIELHLINGYDASAKTRLCEALTDAVRMVVPAPPEAVTIMIHDIGAEGYARGRTPRIPAPALPDPIEIVRSFLSAMEARDLDKAETYLGESFKMQFPGTEEMHNLSELVAWAAPRYRFVKKTYDGFDALHSAGDETLVYARGTLAGEWPDGTAFSEIRFIDRFELTGGKITRQDVWNDIAETKANA